VSAWSRDTEPIGRAAKHKNKLKNKLKNHNKLPRALLLALMAYVVCPHAPAAPTINYEDQKAIMEAQIELLHKEVELQTAWRQAHGGVGLIGPQIVSIASVGEHFVARLDLGQGVQRNVGVGERLSEGLTVLSISAERVSLTSKHGTRSQVLELKFLSAMPTSESAFKGGEATLNLPPSVSAFQQGLNSTPLPMALLSTLPQVGFPQPLALSGLSSHEGQDQHAPTVQRPTALKEPTPLKPPALPNPPSKVSMQREPKNQTGPSLYTGPQMVSNAWVSNALGSSTLSHERPLP
jgi:hypothetical protein